MEDNKKTEAPISLTVMVDPDMLDAVKYALSRVKGIIEVKE